MLAVTHSFTDHLEGKHTAPNRSQRIIAKNTENPNPKNCAEPHGSALGALISGHSLKKSLVGWKHSPEPPAQSLKPLSMSFTPMSIMVGPVTMGGTTRRRIRGGIKAMSISKRAQQAEVPRTDSGN